jgi:hypothetical protein
VIVARRFAAPMAALAVAGFAVGGCAGGGLSDEAYTYCVNQAPPAELDAAAEALNISPDADRDFQTNPNRGDPTFQRVCEYAYNARNRDVGQPGRVPGVEPSPASPSAPLDPQRSAEPISPPAPASPSAA